MRSLSTYLSFVRVSHTVFALPFALTGALLAWRTGGFSIANLGWIAVSMVAARSAAMDSIDLSTRGTMRSIPGRPDANCLVA